MEGSTVPQVAEPGITPESIHRIKSEIALLGELTTDVLKRDVDFGRVLGVSTPFLWDPGASKIIGAFNSYVGSRRLLHLRDDGKVIVAIIEVSLAYRATGLQVGSGVGAASTHETKHKYRWVDNPREWGYTEEGMKGLKTRKDKGRNEYRIGNPEHDELMNTIIKMASKRAEVDAAEGLPGVATALRELFAGVVPAPSKGRREVKEEAIDWSRFWGQVKQMGYTQEEAKQALGVESVKDDWVGKGRTVEEALKVLRDGLTGEPLSEGFESVQSASEDIEAQRESLIREFDAIFERLAWLPGTKEEWCLQNVGYRTTGEMPTASIAAAVAKAMKLLG